MRRGGLKGISADKKLKAALLPLRSESLGFTCISMMTRADFEGTILMGSLVVLIVMEGREEARVRSQTPSSRILSKGQTESSFQSWNSSSSKIFLLLTTDWGALR